MSATLAPLHVDARDRGGAAQPMLIVRGLQRHFHVKGAGKGAVVRAVDGVSFTLFKGETLGVVGESGCGKSTLARLLLHLLPPDAGELVFDGEPVGQPRGIAVADLRKQVQMVFQDSASSLNPRMPVQDSVAFGPLVNGRTRAEARRVAQDILSQVGLRPDLFGPRYPHELSGGQKQRVNIARALAVGPRMVILDEAVSALDKSVEAQVLNLLRQLKRTLNLTYLFISHDLNVVRYISDRVLVMYLGRWWSLARRRWCSAARATRTRGRCSAPACPWTRRGASPPRRWWATRPARSTRPPAAASAPAARTRSRCARRRCPGSGNGRTAPPTLLPAT